LLHPIPLESLLPTTGGHDVPGRAAPESDKSGQRGLTSGDTKAC
jgi:hypothetical protein